MVLNKTKIKSECEVIKNLKLIINQKVNKLNRF